jgi:hemerythrin-like domain-containing protein
MKNPLDFVADDHMREREVCAMIDEIVTSGHSGMADRAQVVAFLTTHLPLHLADEEVDLFPMMLARCEPEDEIGKVIVKLQSDHQYACNDTPKITEILACDDDFSNVAAKQLSTFASQARRHLILENAIILPIARARLTPMDLTTMKDHMLERRRDTPLEETTPC